MFFDLQVLHAFYGHTTFIYEKSSTNYSQATQRL